MRREHLVQRLGEGLREFALADEFGLVDVLRSGHVPTTAEIAALLQDSGSLLPPGVSIPFLAEHLSAKLAQDSSDGVNAIISRLSAIPPGRVSVDEYQTHVMELLGAAFHPFLGKPEKEVRINGARKRIDVVFANRASSGFFARMRHQVPCPFVLLECKNYSSDPKNPDFDQLGLRFSSERGRLGILACRRLHDNVAALHRCRDLLPNGIILLLEDADLQLLVDAKNSGDVEAIDNILTAKHRALVM